MAKRGARTPLYDLIRTRSARDIPSEDLGHGAPAHSSIDGLVRWLSPGRVVRMPVGYVLLALAVVICLLAGSYIVGYHRGDRAVRAEYADAEFNLNWRDRQRTTDPLANANAPLGTDGATRIPPSGSESIDSLASRIPGAGPADQPWGPIQSDPRQPGLNYFVLVETTASGATRIAQYCRDHGLEAYVVRANNRSRWWVIALPGFETSARSSAEIKKLEELIQQIGRSWKRHEGGSTDFGDRYPRLFRG